MVDKRNSPLEARSESEAVRTRHEVQDGKNDSCCLLLLALSPQFAVSVMWIGYVIVYFLAGNQQDLVRWPGNGNYRVKDYGIFFGGRSKCPCQNTCVAVCPCVQIIFWNFWCTDLVILLDSSSCAKCQWLWDNSKRQTIHSFFRPFSLTKSLYIGKLVMGSY